MLSYIYRLVRDFEQRHDTRPNLIYLNQQHFSMLKSQLAKFIGLERLVTLLGMEVVISEEATHPHVASVCPHKLAV